ncbi:MAG: HAMP domain-containing sensor histidine kinase [Bacteroidota bacterium]
MKQPTKIGLLRILLIVSQLVITGFVIQWLIYQYNEQKQALTEELCRQYAESREQVIDSLLLKHVVNPVIRLRHTSGTDTIQQTTQALMAFTVSDSMAAGKESGIPLDIQFQDKEAMLLRSVRLFISQSNDSVHKLEGFSGYIQGGPDSAMFKDVFSKRLTREGISVTFTLTSDSMKADHQSKEKVIFLGDSLSHFFPAAKIGKLNPLILRKMTAQVFFCLILLILTASAFIITFISLKRQLVLNALRNEFVGNISHELKTPVSTVKVALEALRTHDHLKSPEKCDEYVSMASLELNRLEKLVNRVLDQSLLEEKTGLTNPERIDLNDLVAEVIKGLDLRIKSENAQLIFDDSEKGLAVSGDRLYIDSVLMNLIDNSLKYAVPSAEINVRTYSQKGHVCLSVTDNGPGIPHEYQTRIFEKFYRIPGDNRHNVKGYGLGLSFARQVMKQHGGSISVKNLDRGCRFILTFPAPA